MLNWIITLSLLAGCVGLGLYANRQAGKPYDELKPRIIPWTPVMLLCVFGVILTLVHLANLAGIETGPDKSPFGRF